MIGKCNCAGWLILRIPWFYSMFYSELKKNYARMSLVWDFELNADYVLNISFLVKEIKV